MKYQRLFFGKRNMKNISKCLLPIFFNQSALRYIAFMVLLKRHYVSIFCFFSLCLCVCVCVCFVVVVFFWTFGTISLMQYTLYVKTEFSHKAAVRDIVCFHYSS